MKRTTPLTPSQLKKLKKEMVNANAALPPELQQSKHVQRNQQYKQSKRVIIIPKVKNKARKEKALADPLVFMSTYLPQWFTNPFGNCHMEVIKTFLQVMDDKQISLACLPRGSGKTTLAKALLMWTILSKPEQYVVMVTANDKQSKQHIASIKDEFMYNELLFDDFPEVCAVLREVGNIPIKANALEVDGKPCGSCTRADMIKLPYAKNSKIVGNVLQCTTIRSSFRGMNMRNSKTGRMIRPTLLLLDDICTDKSAKSIEEMDNLEQLVNSGIQNLAGHSDGISILITGTIISNVDVIARWSDTDKNPQFHAKKFPAIIQYPPTWDSLWTTYFSMRFSEDKNNDTKHVASMQYYKDNHDAMVKDFIVYWDIYDKKMEFDCYQHWSNKYYSIGAEAFSTEFQHCPKQTIGSILEITPEIVLNNFNNREVLRVPDSHTIITVGIDVNTSYGLSYVVLSSDKSLNSSVIYHGVFSSNGEFVYNAAKSTESEEECLKRELRALFLQLKELPIHNMSGERLGIMAISVDIGYMSRAIQQLIRDVGSSKILGDTLIIPIRGRNEDNFTSNKNIIKRDAHWAIMEADKASCNGNNICNVLVHNADACKENTQQAFFLPVPSEGAISINSTRDRLFHYSELARQICSEQLMIKTTTNKCNKYTWKKHGKNDLLDALSYSRTVAMYCGAVNLQPSIIPVNQPVVKQTPPPKKVAIETHIVAYEDF